MALETGKYISVDMSIYIEQWTSIEDQKSLSMKHDLSAELCRKLVRRERKMTDNNIGLVTDIIAKAIENRKDRLTKDKKHHRRALKLI